MASNVTGEPQQKQGFHLSIPMVIVLMVALAGLGGWWYYASRPRPVAAPKAATPEAKAYAKNLKLSDIKLQATQSFAGGDLVEMTGKVTNAGDREVQRADLLALFFDIYGNEVYRDRVALVKKSLKPGESRDFRLPFDGVTSTWNQAIPDLVIASIEF